MNDWQKLIYTGIHGEIIQLSKKYFNIKQLIIRIRKEFVYNSVNIVNLE